MTDLVEGVAADVDLLLGRLAPDQAVQIVAALTEKYGVVTEEAMRERVQNAVYGTHREL